MSDAPIIELNDFSVTYPDKTSAVKNLSLKIASGESVALIGGNGAGKTSLILALAGVLPFTGAMQISGLPAITGKIDKKTLAALRKKIGIVFQNPDDQLFMSTIYDDVAFGLRQTEKNLSGKEIESRVDKVLSELGIAELKERTVLKLSGGEKRLCAIASVLIMRPEILILDEPTAFLDPAARKNLINLLNTLPQTKIIATHDLDFAAKTCASAIVLKKGALYASGGIAEILRDEDGIF